MSASQPEAKRPMRLTAAMYETRFKASPCCQPAGQRERGMTDERHHPVRVHVGDGARDRDGARRPEVGNCELGDRRVDGPVHPGGIVVETEDRKDQQGGVQLVGPVGAHVRASGLVEPVLDDGRPTTKVTPDRFVAVRAVPAAGARRPVIASISSERAIAASSGRRSSAAGSSAGTSKLA